MSGPIALVLGLVALSLALGLPLLARALRDCLAPRPTDPD